MDEEEEKGGLFEQAQKSSLDMAEMGSLLAARRAELEAEYKKNGVPTPVTRTLKGADVQHGRPEA
jgi:hypothetical protein